MATCPTAGSSAQASAARSSAAAILAITLLAASAGAIIAVGSAAAQQSPAPDFIPDYTFQGSQLADWEPVGQADWQAADGVITGTADAGEGLLAFDQSFQNAALFTRFRC